MGRIVTLMPTRGRLKRAQEAWNSHESTAVLNTTTLMPILDTSDPQFEEYCDWLNDVYADYAGCLGNMVQRTNKIALALDDSIIGWTADDQLFRTPGWDRYVTEAFEDPSVGFVMTNDLHYGPAKAVNIYTRREIIEALGYLCLPTLEHLYVDDAWVELGQGTSSLVYLPSVVVEHMHPVYGKGPNDKQYESLHTQEQYAKDKEQFELWKSSSRYEDFEKVRECLRSSTPA